MLTYNRLAEILARMGDLRILVVGDLFLDRYLEIDRSLAEISLETGLEAHQVTAVRASPGAGGNVVANLRALGVQAGVVSIIGDDGEGYVLRHCLADLDVDTAGLVVAPARFTPTYTKPMMHEPDGRVHELSRLDICNRTPTPQALQELAISALLDLAPGAHGILVADQVSAPEVGVITDAMREALQKSAPSEALRALGQEAPKKISLEEAGAAGMALARRADQTVFVTVGERGILACHKDRARYVPAVPVRGEIDVVGAGDTTIAAILASLCAGASAEEAAQIGNLAASVTIRCIGTTGTASPEEIVATWRACQP